MSHTTSTSSTSTAAKKTTVTNKGSRTQKAQTQVNTPAPAELKELEARMAEKSTALDAAKKASVKAAEKAAKARDEYAHQRYVVAYKRNQDGVASAEDVMILAQTNSQNMLEKALAKFFAVDKELTDEQKQAWDTLAQEIGSLMSAIAETNRLWAKGFSTLYGALGISKKSLTPALLKGVCPFMQVATADGLKAAVPYRRAVRKNGKAVKKNGKRVYTYGLTPVKGWDAKKLYKFLEMNKDMAEKYTDEELQQRKDVLAAEVSAIQAYEAAKAAKKSDVAEEAHDAAKREDVLKSAVKAAKKASKKSATDVAKAA